jgi:hypothetical protein
MKTSNKTNVAFNQKKACEKFHVPYFARTEWDFWGVFAL